MNANITISQVYHNSSLMSFFFRSQAEETFNELCDKANDLYELFDRIEDLFNDLDEFEEFLYDESLDYIFEYIGKEFFDIEEEE